MKYGKVSKGEALAHVGGRDADIAVVGRRIEPSGKTDVDKKGESYQDGGHIRH